MVGVIFTQVGAAGKLTINVDLKHAVILTDARDCNTAARNRHIGGSGCTINGKVCLAVVVDTELPFIALRKEHRRSCSIRNVCGNGETVLAFNAILGIRELATS